jgi:hypothetical protein
VVSRRLLCEEQMREAAVEHVRRATGRLDIEHAVALGHGRRWEVEQRRERAEQQVHLVLADQRVVIRHDRVLIAGVVLDHHLDLAAVEKTAVVVHDRLPDLVALLGRLARLREVTGERERGADLDRRLASTTAAAAVVVAATAARTYQRRDRQNARQQHLQSSHFHSPRSTPAASSPVVVSIRVHCCKRLR